MADLLGSISADDIPPELAEFLPEELLQSSAKKDKAKQDRLQTLSQVISKKRDEAISARSASGIEEEWIEDEESYQGIDDANRGDSKTIKPTTSAGGLMKNPTGSETRSTVFLNITRPYVDSSAARVADMLLPTDDRNWAIRPTPVPDMVNAKPTPLVGANGQPAMRPATADEIQALQQQQDPATASAAAQTPSQPGQQTAIAQGVQAMGQQQMVPLTVKDLADAAIEKASQSAEAAQRRIDDWMVECQYHAEVRKVIEDCARLGTGILKGPYPSKHRTTAVEQTEEGFKLTIKVDIGPASRRVDPWNIFPDGACGENIHNGSHLFEKDNLTGRKLRDLKDLPGYLNDQIDAALEEGPQRGTADTKNPAVRDLEQSEKDQFEIWYFYGEIERNDLEAAGTDLEGEDPTATAFYAIITMVNGRVIKAALNPLDSGEFPYDVMNWQRRAGHWAGIGVSRQVRTPQRILNGATRNMMDNAGLAGGPIFGIRKGDVTPADGTWAITPRKIFFLAEGSDIDDIRKAITSVEIPIAVTELMTIIQFALKIAEDVTGLPMLMQGQQGNSAPDTYGGQILVTNNASTVLRRIARTFDDRITEPHVRRYYEWLLMYGPEESEKGDFTIDARGSAALVEREIQAQEITQILESSLNPVFGLDPKRCVSEYLKARRFDPKKFQYTEAEAAEMAKKPQPLPPAVMAAQIRGQSAAQVQGLKNQAELQLVQQEAEHEQQMLANGQATPHMATASARIEEARIRANSAETVQMARSQAELAYAETEAQMARDNAHARLVELQLKRDLAILDYTSKHNLTLEQTKAELAKTAMQETTKRQVAAVEAQVAVNEGHAGRQHDLNKVAVDAQSVAEPEVAPA